MKKIIYYCDRCGAQISGKIFKLATFFGDPADKEADWIVEDGAELCEECFKFVDDKTLAAIQSIKAPLPKPVKEKAPVKKVRLDMGKVKALRAAGWSFDKIGDEMGVSGQTILNHLKSEEEAQE